MTAAGRTQTYTWDDASILTSLTDGTSAISFTLDAAGREKTATYPGGWTRSYDTDTTGQIRAIQYAHNGTTAGSLSYDRDIRGLPSGLSGTLAHIAIPAAQSTGSCNAANRLSALNGQARTYDADGNLTANGQTHYTWNDREQLTAITAPGTGRVLRLRPARHTDHQDHRRCHHQIPHHPGDHGRSGQFPDPRTERHHSGLPDRCHRQRSRPRQPRRHHPDHLHLRPLRCHHHIRRRQRQRLRFHRPGKRRHRPGLLPRPLLRPHSWQLHLRRPHRPGRRHQSLPVRARLTHYLHRPHRRQPPAGLLRRGRACQRGSRLPRPTAIRPQSQLGPSRLLRADRVSGGDACPGR